MAADPKTSEGARLERRALRAYLRRRLKKIPVITTDMSKAAAALTLNEVLEFVLTRQRRYDKDQGGLGRRLGRR